MFRVVAALALVLRASGLQAESRMLQEFERHIACHFRILHGIRPFGFPRSDSSHWELQHVAGRIMLINVTMFFILWLWIHESIGSNVILK